MGASSLLLFPSENPLYLLRSEGHSLRLLIGNDVLPLGSTKVNLSAIPITKHVGHAIDLLELLHILAMADIGSLGKKGLSLFVF